MVADRLCADGEYWLSPQVWKTPFGYTVSLCKRDYRPTWHVRTHNHTAKVETYSAVYTVLKYVLYYSWLHLLPVVPFILPKRVEWIDAWYGWETWGMRTNFLLINLNGGDYFGDVCDRSVGKIAVGPLQHNPSWHLFHFRWDKYLCRSLQTELRTRTVESSCEHDTESFGSIKTNVTVRF
jgi:hypothetical protein